MDRRGEGKRRNEQKRKSRIYIDDSGAEEKSNRPERKSSLRAAQNGTEDGINAGRRKAPESKPDQASTPRPKTPVPISAYNTSRTDSPLSSDHQTPTARSRGNTPSPQRDDGRQSRPSSKSSQSRPRTRTLEERFRDRSPGSVISRSRNRVGSLNSPPTQEDGSDKASIGYPSIVPSPRPETHKPRSQRNVNTTSRPLSPIRNPIAAKPGTPLSSSSTDAKKILQLMKTTCGRMAGVVSFRTSAASNWASGYCAINVASGSLIYQAKGEVNLAKTLISDLRGCQVRTLYDAESRSTFLDVSSCRNANAVHLRPHVPEAFDSWLAALLCWQPIRPKGAQNKMAKPPEPYNLERRLGERKGSIHDSHAKDATIIKVGKMFMWDKDPQARESAPHPASRRVSTYKPLKPMSKNWRRVSCTLQDNGHLKVFAEPEATLEAFVPLSQLSRCAIQRLDQSMLDDEFSVAILPQYTLGNSRLVPLQTIYLSLDSRVLFEVWFVLLRAFTIPELYGPESMRQESHSTSLDSSATSPKPPNVDMFRVERRLTLRIIEARLHPQRQEKPANSSRDGEERPRSKKVKASGNYYAEIQLDGEARARTSIKLDTSNPGFYEDFEFSDLPPVLASSSIELKSRNPGQKNWSLTRAPSDLERGDINPGTIEGDIQVSPLDLTYGKVDFRLDEAPKSIDHEKWWEILDERGQVVGEILMKIRLDELVVLMGRDYAPISEMLHSFSNGLTNQVTQMAHIELKRLSEILLNIFQVSGHASAWLMTLVEEEIDSIHKETPMSKYRHGRRIASHDSYESNAERELFVRDLGKNATAEANLLFRGNSLLTKALDSHMRRLGKEYLEDTLGQKMRDIEESDPECEVDPHRVRNPDDLSRNWRNLISLTENIWQAISGSASRCPPELRIIMRRIRDCAEERYGDFLQTVAYSSVSGFLFLRFFCPSVLNPRLFGLLKGMLPLPSHGVTSADHGLDHPRPRAQRTLTLITKTLQTLANLTTFGNKEPWMEPMNVFLTGHRPEFKAFINEICDISSERATSAIPPSYATPITILGRLPGTSREGFPSLPYLIDQARECANLVSVWLDARHEVDNGVEWSEELKQFDDLCEESREKAKECLMLAEQAERPSGTLEPKWQELVRDMERKARVEEPKGGNSSLNTPTSTHGSRTINSSTSSIADSYFQRSHHPSRSSPAASRLAMVRSPVSPHSPLSQDEGLSSETGESATLDTPPGSSSGPPRTNGMASYPHRNPLSAPSSGTEDDDDDDASELDLDPENNTDILGSSIYSLTPGNSKRDSSATTKTITPRKPAPATPIQNINSRWRHHQEKGARSAYSLRRAKERADISKTVGSRGSDRTLMSRDASHHEGATWDQGQSLYQLRSGSQNPEPEDRGVGTPRSPTTEKKDMRAVFGSGLFRKKGRDKEEG